MESVSKGHNYGVDVLRIVAAFMVVILHTLKVLECLKEPVNITSVGYWTIEAVSICAVNIFGLVTGYFFSEQKCTPRRMLKFWVIVLFYSILVFTVNTVSVGEFSIKEFIRSLFPVCEKRFWYFTAYFMLILITPAFNLVINNCKKNLYLSYLIIIGFCYTIISMIFEPFSISYGYSWMWLAYLYFVGAYIRIFGLFTRNKVILFCVYLISTVAIVMFKLLCGIIGENSMLTVRVFSTAYNYNCIFVFLQAVVIFSIFVQVKTLKINNLIRKVSKLTFGIYLGHSVLLPIVIEYIEEINVCLGVKVILVAVITFVASAVLEILRNKIFVVFRIDSVVERLLKLNYSKHEVLDT